MNFFLFHPYKTSWILLDLRTSLFTLPTWFFFVYSFTKAKGRIANLFSINYIHTYPAITGTVPFNLKGNSLITCLYSKHSSLKEEVKQNKVLAIISKLFECRRSLKFIYLVCWPRSDIPEDCYTLYFRHCARLRRAIFVLLVIVRENHLFVSFLILFFSSSVMLSSFFFTLSMDVWKSIR